MDTKPIPAFYCCYLLRSTVRQASLYVGSTPNPQRRLEQHNGKTKGGAVRTSRTNLRPWEMACIVAGFPSNIAALQFEWAWQNPHLTRHIATDERLSFSSPTSQIRISRSTGRKVSRPGRPRVSLVEKMSNLHLLLRSKYFSKWPLEVRFFSEQVYRSWQSWCQRVDHQVRPGIQVLLDLPESHSDPDIPTSGQTRASHQESTLVGNGGIGGIDATYAQYRDVVEKGRLILDEGDGQSCHICSKPLETKSDLFAICPSDECMALSHISCLALRFLQKDRESCLVPDRGNCPSCRTDLKWSDLMTEVTLRGRGGKEIGKLLKRKRGTKAEAAAEILETEENEDEDNEVDEQDDDLVLHESASEASIIGDSDDECGVVPLSRFGSVVSYGPTKSRSPKARTNDRVEIVIEDSEDER